MPNTEQLITKVVDSDTPSRAASVIQSGSYGAVVTQDSILASVQETGLPIREADTTFLDAFGRKRVSNTGQRFDIEFIFNKQPLLIDEIANGGATATHNANSRDVTLAIVNTTTDTAIGLYSHFDIPYTAGNSQLFDITATLDNAAIGGGIAQVFLRTSVTGSIVETAYNQADWNMDTVGSANWAYSQIFKIDFQSLKVGRVRFILVRGGEDVLVHTIENDNIRNTGYWQNPTLPMYWRIYNDANYCYMEVGYGDTENAIGFRYRIAKNANATMRAICGTVKSEGGRDLFELYGFNKSADNGVTPKTVSTTLIPILSIRPRSTFNSLTNRGLYIPNSWNVQASNSIKVALVYRGTLTNASFANVDTNYSGMEYDTAATAITGGIVVDTDYVSTGVVNRPVKEDGLLGRTLLSLGRTGTADILSICAIKTDTNDASVLSSIQWKEIR